jgi:hypothetical protein
MKKNQSPTIQHPRSRSAFPTEASALVFAEISSFSEDG